MARRARVDRAPEQKLEIVLEGLKSGNIAETCRRFQIAANLYYHWKDEALQGAFAGAEGAGDRNPKKRRGGVSCGEVHSQAREMVEQG